MRLRLLSYNIRYGGRGREKAICAVIRAADPDVVILQEATDRGVIEMLARETGLTTWDSRPKHSTGYLSRVPVVQSAWHRPFGARHAFLEVQLQAPEMRLFGLHLSAWFSNWTERRRAFEIGSLLHAIREHQHGFHLIAGDFNALAPGERLRFDRMPHWIKAMVWLQGRDITRHTIQHMLDRRYVDAWRVLHPNGEEGYTFPTWDPHVRLDYVFTPERYKEQLGRCAVFTEAAEAKTASDHFPLLLEFDV
jgi:endonuclease/exonuclease/phosphatase family metal-dependent hydrolase